VTSQHFFASFLREVVFDSIHLQNTKRNSQRLKPFLDSFCKVCQRLVLFSKMSSVVSVHDDENLTTTISQSLRLFCIEVSPTTDTIKNNTSHTVLLKKFTEHGNIGLSFAPHL